MRRTVLTDANRIVREDVDVGQTSKRTKANRSAAIIGKDEKRRARGAENSVIRNAVHDRAHAVLANTKMDIAAFRSLTREIPAVLDVIQCRSLPIRAAPPGQALRLAAWL